MRALLLGLGWLLTAAGCGGAASASSPAPYSPPSTDPKAFSYFEHGKFVSEPIAAVKAREAAAKGKEAWRTDPLHRAATIRPGVPEPDRRDKPPSPEFQGNRATYRCGYWTFTYTLTEQQTDRAVVVQGRPTGPPEYRLILRRPFGKWWYITAITLREPHLNSMLRARWVVEAEVVKELSPNHWLCKMSSVFGEGAPGSSGSRFDSRARGPEYFVAWWEGKVEAVRAAVSIRYRDIPANFFLFRPGAKLLLVMDDAFVPEGVYPVGSEAKYAGGLTRDELARRLYNGRHATETAAAFVEALSRQNWAGAREFLSHTWWVETGTAEKAKQYLAKQGLTPEIAVGLMANPVVETVTDDTATFGIHATVPVPLAERGPGYTAYDGTLTLTRTRIMMGMKGWEVAGIEMKRHER